MLALATMRITNRTPNAPAASPAARRRVLASWLVNAPTARNSADDATSAIREVHRSADAEAGVPGAALRDDDQRRHRVHEHQRRTEPAHRLTGGASARRAPREQQLPPARFLLTAEETGAGQQAPDRADEHRDADRTPRREAGDGVDVVRRSEQRLDPGVAPERDAKTRAVGGGRVGGHEAGHRGDDDRAEHRAPQGGLQRGTARDEARHERRRAPTRGFDVCDVDR